MEDDDLDKHPNIRDSGHLHFDLVNHVHHVDPLDPDIHHVRHLVKGNEIVDR